MFDSNLEIMKLDGALLVAFCTVAQELNFSKAAQRLFISQPPLSRRIRQLESVVGTELFVRTTRSVELTPAGVLLYEHARRITSDMNHMLASVREYARGEKGSLSVGMAPTTAWSYLIESLHEFRRKNPGIALDIREMDSVQLAEELRQGRLDMAFMRPVDVADSVEMIVVHTEPLRFVTRIEHAQPGHRVSIDQLVKHELIGYEKSQSPYLAGLFERLLRDVSDQVRLAQRSWLPSILTLVEAGVGAAIVPKSMENLGRQKLVFHEMDAPQSVMAQHVVARPKNGMNPNALTLIGTLLSKA